MSSARISVLGPGVALLAGTGLGVLGPLLEAAANPVAHVAHLILAAGWSWAALAFFVGLGCRSRMHSLIFAPIALAAGVMAYYSVKLERGQFLQAVALEDPSQGAQVSWAHFLSKIIFWGLAAIFLGLILGLTGNLARSQEAHGTVFRIIIPVVAIVETTMRLRAEGSLQEGITSATWTVTRLVAIAVILFLASRLLIARSASKERNSYQPHPIKSDGKD
ncbi:hypothetical protein [Streptomyces sp. ID05-47C]|uniref:hypothetical protein n=1 Tax=Streptomyces sp. ID05-47C TaxID=3028665 RepID=UPI0029BE908A|nr:hypothetical protein [Streptomyces sp. ID05-47C]MDX3574396.1 hypothetical protein [Streptomyces sp. ID05-47C]